MKKYSGRHLFSGHGVFLTKKLISFDVDEKDRPHVFPQFDVSIFHITVLQEAQLLPRDRAMRRVT